MKHISIIMAAVVFVLSVHTAKAESSTTPYLEFTYAGYPNGAGGFSAPSYRGGAMLITEDVAERFDGCSITEVIIANGTFFGLNEAPIEIFFTRALEEKAFYSQEGMMDIDHPKEFKAHPLSTPMEIHAGEPFFVGFVS